MDSLVPNEVSASLAALLQDLSSADNQKRSQAEKLLNQEWVANKPEYLFVGLAQQACINKDDIMRSFAAILFRRIASRQPDNTQDVSEKLINHLNSNVLQKLREIFLNAFINETNNDVRHKLCDAISELINARGNDIDSNTVSSDSWSELRSTLLVNAVQSPNEGKRESCFRIFATSPELIGKSNFELILPVYKHAFINDTSELVKITAINSFCEFFKFLPSSTWQSLKPLLPDVLNVLPPLHLNKKSDELTRSITPLTELAGIAPRMFKDMFKSTLDFGISIIKDKSLDDTTRQAALELLTTFADEAPKMCKKERSYVPDMIVQCLSMMIELDNDDGADGCADWLEDDDINGDDADSNLVAARQSLDRISLRLNGDNVLPPLFEWLPRMISSSDWRERHAALMAISSVAEGCSDVLIAELSRVLDMILPLLSDPHPRVRWAACNAIGQMCTDLAPNMQQDFGDRILPALISTLNSPEPRVQTHAAAALVNFAEEATNATLNPFLDSLLSRLLELLQSSKKYLQEQSLTTIAVIADAAGNKFAKYYDTLMPLLINVMAADTGKEHRLLKGRCIECSSLIALAVGKEIFSPHAVEIVRIYAEVQNSITDPDDPCTAYLLQAWGRICSVIGDDFIPYLSGVMPPLISAAEAGPDIKVIEDETEIDSLEQKEGWEVLPFNGKHLGIRTALLDDKCTAIELITSYALELKDSFAEYSEPVLMRISLPGLSFMFHDGVRFASAQSIPLLLSSVYAASKGDLTKVSPIAQATLEKVIECLANEPMVEVQAVLYTCLCESIEVLNGNFITPEMMRKFASGVNETMDQYATRVENRGREENDYIEDTDKDEEELADDELLTEMSKAIHAFFQYRKKEFLPAFEILLEPLTKWSSSAANIDALQWSLGVFDDLIEFTGEASWNYSEYFLSTMAQAITSPVPELRQASAYGIGLAGQYGGQSFKEAAISSLPTLFQLAQPENKVQPGNIEPTENAVSAIAKIIHSHLSEIPQINELLDSWVKCLPVLQDQEAAAYTYTFLAELMENKHPSVMNQVPQVFDAVVQALEFESIKGRITERVVISTKTLLSSIPEQQALSLFNSLPVERQEVVRKWLGA